MYGFRSQRPMPPCIMATYSNAITDKQEQYARKNFNVELNYQHTQCALSRRAPERYCGRLRPLAGCGVAASDAGRPASSALCSCSSLRYPIKCIDCRTFSSLLAAPSRSRRGDSVSGDGSVAARRAASLIVRSEASFRKYVLAAWPTPKAPWPKYAVCK